MQLLLSSLLQGLSQRGCVSKGRRKEGIPAKKKKGEAATTARSGRATKTERKKSHCAQIANCK